MTVTLMLVLAVVIPDQIWRTSVPSYDSALVAPVALLVALQLIGLRILRVHRRAWRFTTLSDVTAIAGGLTLGTVVTALLGLLAQQLDMAVPAAALLASATAFPVGLLAAMLVSSFNLQVLVRIIRRATANRQGSPQSPRSQLSRRTLVIGSGELAAGVLRDAFAQVEGGPDIIGLLTDELARGDLVAGVPVLGPISELESVVRTHEVTLIIIASEQCEPEQLRALVGRAHRIGLLVRIRPSEPLAGVDRDALVVRPVDLGDLMPRTVASMDTADISRLVSGRSVIVTGAAGSIGSELARQLLRLRPSRLILIDRSEYGLWALERELASEAPLGVVEPVLMDVRDPQLIASAFETHAPAVVFHAAALKHVPMLERNVSVAVLNNVLGTASVAEACVRTGVTRLVLVSTDKAVRPTSIMGATKRLAERIVSDAAARTGRDFVSVRFGNVLGSSGSVLEVFRAQIEAGGPITVTDPEMTRYFMTIPEASGLVLHAATLSGPGEVLLLDMGEPRRIVDLVEDLVRLHGLEPGVDIEVVFTGRRAGEKLHEELAQPGEHLSRTDHPSILSLGGQVHRWLERDAVLMELRDLARANDVDRLRARLLEVANEDSSADDDARMHLQLDVAANA